MRKLICTILLSLAVPSASWALLVGTNIHSRTSQDISDLMKARNIRTARMDLTAASNSVALHDHVSRIRANGGKVEVSLQISYQWNHTCDQDLVKVEQSSFDETSVLVNRYKDVIHDYELLNEVTLRPETRAEVPFNSAGTATAPYADKPCYRTITAVLRGMSRAIHDIKASSGLPLRVILGTVGRDFGFLTYMQQQGVVVDVVGYHIYPRSGDPSLLSDPWFGAGGPLAQLAVFGLPVHINELNCGEIYDADYDNVANSAKTLKCFQSYKKHLASLFSQKLINLESVHVYELLDEPNKSPPENRFGLMYDITTPKAHLYIITAFAGGALSAAERQMVIDLGALTSAEIDAYWELARKESPGALAAPRNLRVMR